MYTIKANTGTDLLNGRFGCWVENRNGTPVFRGGYQECVDWVKANG